VVEVEVVGTVEIQVVEVEEDSYMMGDRIRAIVGVIIVDTEI
jgi:hypothetical protein